MRWDIRDKGMSYPTCVCFFSAALVAPAGYEPSSSAWAWAGCHTGCCTATTAIRTPGSACSWLHQVEGLNLWLGEGGLGGLDQTGACAGPAIWRFATPRTSINSLKPPQEGPAPGREFSSRTLASRSLSSSHRGMAFCACRLVTGPLPLTSSQPSQSRARAPQIPQSKHHQTHQTKRCV